jgi:hypothetical protein
MKESSWISKELNGTPLEIMNANLEIIDGSVKSKPANPFSKRFEVASELMIVNSCELRRPL